MKKRLTRKCEHCSRRPARVVAIIGTKNLKLCEECEKKLRGNGK